MGPFRNHMNTSNIRNRTLILIAGDTVAITLFLLIGEIQHGLLETYNPVVRTLAQAAMVTPPVILLSGLLGSYAHPPINGWRDVARFLLRSALAWVLAAPLGLVIRAWGLQSATIVMPFVNAALAFGGLLLLLWRGAYALVALAQNRQQAPAAKRDTDK
jgi:hypothetical protein